jgi:hypothetical protein
MKTKVLFIIAIALYSSISAVSQEVIVLDDPLFNNPEGIIYDEQANQYFVGNAEDGKILIIDSLNNVSVFKETVGAGMIMAFEIVHDSLLISTNYPRTLTCINKNTGDPIFILNLNNIANACSQMTYDNRTGLLYIVEQYGKILKANIKIPSCNIFATSGIPGGSQTIELDTIENRLILFTWPSSIVKYINIYDSTDVSNGPPTGTTQYTCSTMDNDRYIYVSSWSGNKVMKMHMDSLDNAEIFCNESLFQPVGITYNPDKGNFAICNNGNNTIAFVHNSDTITNIKYQQGDYMHKMKIVFNPSLNKIKIEFNGSPQRKYQVNIIDTTGKNLINKTFQNTASGKNNIHLSTRGLSKGIYLVQLREADTVIGAGKFILN